MNSKSVNSNISKIFLGNPLKSISWTRIKESSAKTHGFKKQFHTQADYRKNHGSITSHGTKGMWKVSFKKKLLKWLKCKPVGHIEIVVDTLLKIWKIILCEYIFCETYIKYKTYVRIEAPTACNLFRNLI